MAMLILSVVLVLIAQCRPESVNSYTNVSNPKHHYLISHFMRYQSDAKTWQAAKEFCPTVGDEFVLMNQYSPWTAKVMWEEEVPAGVDKIWSSIECNYYKRNDQSTYPDELCNSVRPFVCVKTTRVEVPVKDFS
ncbi:uncharacterized protein LOC135496053 [Lineus longissimus]|uniref:uncharacterized protein LOC135496053 n=1 Tax=Lineus longissimus TaxID=88925 RepID=UPI002B4F5B7A